MAARDVKLYLSLKQALIDKVANPNLTSHTLEVDGAKRSYDYDYIFQTARRVFPQKYNLGHSYLNQTPISNLQSDDLKKLNLEYAEDIVKGWGGVDKSQIKDKELDSQLIEYEKELTAPDEPDYLYKELDQHAQPEVNNESPNESEETSSNDQGETSGLGGSSQRQSRVIINRPLTNKERFGTKEAYGEYKEANKESRSEQARKLWENRKKASFNKEQYGQYKEENKEDRKKRAEELWKRRKAGLLKPSAKPGGWNPFGDWAAKKLGEKIAQSRLGQAVARNFIDPLKQIVQNSRAWQAVAPRIKPLIDLADKIASPFRAASHWLGGPERWLNKNILDPLSKWANTQTMNALKSGLELAKSGINNLINAAKQYWGAGPSSWAAREALRQAAIRAGVQAGWSAVVAAAPILLVYGLIIAVFLFGWWYSSLFNDINCDKPGRMEVKKVLENPRSGLDSVGNGDQIDYQIQINYIWLCDKINLPTVTITDTVPRSVEYVPGSAKSESPAYGPGPDGTYDPASRVITWNLTNISSNDPYGVIFSVKPNKQDDGTWSLQDTWLQNQATVIYRAPTSRSSGGFSDITGLLPSPITPVPADWDGVKAQIIAAYTKHPELISMYKQASAETGVPWQVLAGLHFVETGSGPGPDSSLVSGRKIGQVEPDVSPVKCAAGVSGPGKPVPLGGGCGFTNQLDSAIYAGNHLAEKIGKVPSTFPEAVEAMSKYNGGGNANCGEGLDYGPCPPQFYGEDDPYAMADFDEAHSSKKMYVIFCSDRTRCNPKKVFNRPGAMGVVRALIEEGL